MNRRKFIKTVSQIMIAWGLSPKLAFASETNKILSGKFFIDGKEAELNFQDLNNSTIETKDEKSIIKFKDDFYLIRPETKLQFVSKNLLKVIKGSVHAVFGKRQEELNVEIPHGTIGIRGTLFSLILSLNRTEVIFVIVMEKQFSMTKKEIY